MTNVTHNKNALPIFEPLHKHFVLCPESPDKFVSKDPARKGCGTGLLSVLLTNPGRILKNRMTKRLKWPGKFISSESHLNGATPCLVMAVWVPLLTVIVASQTVSQSSL